MDPIKVIFQFKNSKRKIQHHIYIYVGKVETDIQEILEQIKSKTLIQTLRTLTKQKFTLLEKTYGVKWYEFFFTQYHMFKSFKIMKSNISVKDEIVKIRSIEWYNNHVSTFEKQNKQLHYTYEVNYAQQSKIAKRITKDEDNIIELENNDNLQNQLMDKLSNKNFLSKKTVKEFFSRDIIQKGGSDFENTESDEINLEEMENLYKAEDVKLDSNIEKTKAEIMKVVKITKKKNVMAIFDNSKDEIYSDESLEDVVFKNYITTQYINKDDTIKTIKDKICCSIMNNEKFGKRRFIIPSRQYLWTEYYYNNTFNNVSLSHRWIKKGNTANISIKPEKLSNYEKLKKENLLNLKYDLSSNISKLKREDNDDKILDDFTNYYDANTIFMIDIYNELGKDYKKQQQTEYANLIGTYMKLYFPQIPDDEIDNILQYLESQTSHNTQEAIKMKTVYETLFNDLLLINEVIDEVEHIKYNNTDHKKMFGNKFITNSTINVNLNTADKKDNITRIDFFKMFNEFETNENYPFIQYQSSTGSMVFKFNTKYIEEYTKKKENVDVLMKWFESSPYGFNVKMKITMSNMTNNFEDIKFVGVTIGNNGNLEYRIQWKEDNNASLENIRETYNDIKTLVKKINSESQSGNIFQIPHDYEFRYAFINCIQHFVLNEKFAINHNDLSEFSRYFYPYIALVIYPRKRVSKQLISHSEYGKYGTYLRYKRISNYYNKKKVEQQIIYFLRYYENNLNAMIDEVSKQFNITKEKAMDEITSVSDKYPVIKKGRKILKEFKNIPRKKPLGIGIEIQGKTKMKYKIRISGCRNEKQLNNIISFLNVLIYLYSETFLYKKPERIRMLEKLKTLTSIAKRRDKVEYIADYNEENNISELKKKTKTDVDRIGFEASKGQNQWSRMCQNSGSQNRQPKQDNNINTILKQGYKLNEKTGLYEKKVVIGKKTHILRVVQFAKKQQSEISEEAGNEDENKIFYSCDPKINGEFMNIGFLTKGRNPTGKCMPCCYKKDQLQSKNKVKVNKFLSCTRNENTKTPETKDSTTQNIQTSAQVGDILYILHNTNKIQENRMSLLPPNLNLIFNVSNNLSLLVDGNYISQTNGFFVKYGVNQLSNAFINSISNVLDITPAKLIAKLCDVLKNDNNNIIFNALNNGVIRQNFTTKEKYAEYLMKETNIQPKNIVHFLSIPGVITSHGLNIIVFTEIEGTKDFNLMCQDVENENTIYDEKRHNIIIVNETDNFYPIVKISKIKNSKTIKILKHFHGINEFKILEEFYISNCKINFFLDNNPNMTAKMVSKILRDMNTKFHPYLQIIDSRYKANYIITKNKIIIPVTPSGSVHDLDIDTSINKYISGFKQTYDNCIEITSSNSKIDLTPLTLYYLHHTSSDPTIIGIRTKYGNIPVIQTVVKTSWITKNKLKLEKQQLIDTIDAKLEKRSIIIDDRIKSVNRKNYEYENYNLFRLELSEYFSRNPTIKNEILDILKLPNKSDQKKKLLEVMNKIGDNSKKNNSAFVEIKKYPDTDNYVVENFRTSCFSKPKNCNTKHCMIYGNKCVFTLAAQLKKIYFEKIINELVNDKIKMMELLNQDEYFIPDVVDYNRYKIKLDQKIIKSTNVAIKSELQQIFKNSSIPVIRKRRKDIYEDEELLNANHPLKDMGTYLIQEIAHSDSPIYRAFTNSYIWYKQKIYYSYQINMGYYSEKQTSYANYFKSIVVDWLKNIQNADQISLIIKTFAIKKSLSAIIKSIHNNEILSRSINVLELFALHNIYKIPIIIYDGLFDSVASIVDNKIVNNNKKYNLRNINSKEMNDAIHLGIEYNTDNFIESIHSIYIK